MKRIMKSLAIVAVAIFAGYNVYQSNNETEGMSDTMLANVEALATPEYSAKVWNRHDYTMDNGYPAVNCWKGGSEDCLLK